GQKYFFVNGDAGDWLKQSDRHIIGRIADDSVSVSFLLLGTIFNIASVIGLILHIGMNGFMKKQR
ncbi:MAG TPA: hypothetical protein VEY51_03965, partial [Chondromyces sp.]|nr:hypothetical protein [Chondromyces sp.]